MLKYLQSPLGRSAPRVLRILIWNVDFASPNISLRMSVLLTHLQSLLGGEPSPIILLLQEVHPEALGLILEHTWVRDNFAVTNTVLPGYSPTYGTVTLVVKVLASLVGCCFRVPYQELAMGRNALFVDLRIVVLRVASQGGTRGSLLRVGDTHLESLQGRGTAFRQAQLALVKDVLLVPGIYAGLVAGDMNAISTEDLDLVERLGLKDLWMGEGSETWGYQPPCMFPLGRPDKMLVLGNVGLTRDTRAELVGVGLKVEEDRECYVSDHYGLLAAIQVGDSVSLES